MRAPVSALLVTSELLLLPLLADWLSDLWWVCHVTGMTGKVLVFVTSFCDVIKASTCYLIDTRVKPDICHFFLRHSFSWRQSEHISLLVNQSSPVNWRHIRMCTCPCTSEVWLWCHWLCPLLSITQAQEKNVGGWLKGLDMSGWLPINVHLSDDETHSWSVKKGPNKGRKGFDLRSTFTVRFETTVRSYYNASNYLKWVVIRKNCVFQG